MYITIITKEQYFWDVFSLKHRDSFGKESEKKKNFLYLIRHYPKYASEQLSRFDVKWINDHDNLTPWKV